MDARYAILLVPMAFIALGVWYWCFRLPQRRYEESRRSKRMIGNLDGQQEIILGYLATKTGVAVVPLDMLEKQLRGLDDPNRYARHALGRLMTIGCVVQVAGGYRVTPMGRMIYQDLMDGTAAQ